MNIMRKYILLASAGSLLFLGSGLASITSSTLPNGDEFKVWENQTQYKKTYIVDKHHPKASDENNGTFDAPFLTINKAAQVVRAGERVLIKSGVYREKVMPRFGGKSPQEMISYEAAPGARVVIKGSRILDNNWEPSVNPNHLSRKLWMIKLDPNIFPEDNPFAIENANEKDIEIMPWASDWAGRYPYTLKRGLIFQCGKRLAQLATYEDLVRLPGSFWVDPSGLIIHIHFFDGKKPNDCVVEVTVQQQLFVPQKTDLGYIQVKGICFEHAGNGFPRTGTGALFTNGGHHWLICDNEFHQVNSVAVEIGGMFEEIADPVRSRKQYDRRKTHQGYTIVRNNHISHCGTGGIQGMVNIHALVEDNYLHNIGWQDVETYWECGAVKLLLCTGTLVRRNLIHDSHAGCAIWLDYAIVNSRITQNTVFDMTMWGNGALFIEASKTSNWIDHNIVWDIDGIPIYGGDCDSLLIAHNLIGPCTNSPIYPIVGTDRLWQGKPFTSKHHRIVHNIIYTETPLMISDKDNLCDFNLFSSDYELKKWQSEGFDKNSKQSDFKLKLNMKSNTLIMKSESLFPRFKNRYKFGHDFYNNFRKGDATVGPFQDQFNGRVELDIDPRNN